MNDKKIKEIEERVEKATPGTWKVEKYYHDEPYEKYIKSAAIVCRNQTITRNDWSNPVEADLDFIAHARQDIPYLLKIINELNDENISIRNWNACEKELFEKYQADSKRFIEVEAELAEYKDLEEQGLLIKLPCKVGTDIFRIVNKRIGRGNNRKFNLTIQRGKAQWGDYDKFGKTAFLTREEAEKALEVE